MRQHLMDYREGWTVNDIKAWCRSLSEAWSVGFIGPGGNVATAGVTRAGGMPVFGCETDPFRKSLFEDLTNLACLGDIFQLNWDMLPAALVWLITLPCIDFARSGRQLGKYG